MHTQREATSWNEIAAGLLVVKPEALATVGGSRAAAWRVVRAVPRGAQSPVSSVRYVGKNRKKSQTQCAFHVSGLPHTF